ncbi:CGNR zinc finger domain-containing protein [Cryobacterium sp. PH31-AA6]|uniref:CGNR zinc finger domain-containing protein n=1 Tax=Cryobacterium sp. PH31-AA6 TaxID=3046205 RepID=UPI0024BAA0FC|nr:CGNR zinc finger domain-containing protein [Cryobacterium sp. PH31-AA6]MDJ0323791.1 CGNR zinc finger domain-containing protein [Cryobacterium sp. PH31-AA6]
MEKMGSERSWVLAEEPTPVRLMATIWADTDGLHDDFAVPSDVDAWLDAVGVDREGVTATQEELQSALNLRDSVRRLAAHVTDDQRSAAASTVAHVDDAARIVNVAASARTIPLLRLNDGRLVLAADSAVSPVGAGLAEVAYEALHLLGENGSHLRACYAPGCVLYFLKTHPRREWCSVACGNRARAARHYQSVRSARVGPERTSH